MRMQRRSSPFPKRRCVCRCHFGRCTPLPLLLVRHLRDRRRLHLPHQRHCHSALRFSALLAHLSITQSKVGVAAAPYVVIVTGGGPASAEGIRAKWRAVTDTAPAGSIAFHVSSIPTGGEAVDVGQLTLKIALPAATK